MKTIIQKLFNVFLPGIGTTKRTKLSNQKNSNSMLAHRQKKILCLCILIILLIAVQAFSKGWDCAQQTKFKKRWSINANVGITSYFGDLSIYDTDIQHKILLESGGSFGGVLTRHFNRITSISGQVLIGQIQAFHNRHNFKTQLLEYNLHAKFDFMNAFSANNDNKLGIVGIAGIGHLLFRSVKNLNNGLESEEVVYQSSVPEFVYFFGGGLYYDLTERIGINLDLVLKQFQNDRLDHYVYGDNNDYYTYLSFGITYHLHK